MNTLHGPAMAIGYYLWLRTRWILAGFVAVAVLVPLAQRVVITAAAPQAYSQVITTAGAMASLILFVLLVSQFGYAGADVSTRESAFPRWMMTLPARPVALAGWPMLFGSAVCALTFLLLLYALLPRQQFAQVPRWSLLGAAALCAWLQAVSWTPFWWPMARVVAAVISLLIITGLVIVAQTMGASTSVLFIVQAALLVLAWVVGTQGVARARRGDGSRSPWSGGAIQTRTRPVDPTLAFRSASAAMLWVELRRNMVIAPFISLLAPVLILVLAIVHPGRPSAASIWIGGKMISSTMMMVAIFIGSPLACSFILNGTLAKFDTWLPHLTVPNFLAVRPVSAAQIVAVKFGSVAIATALTWVATYLLLIAWALLPWSYAPHQSVAHWVVAHLQTRYLLWGLLMAAALPLISWKLTIQSFWVYLYGRRWLINLVAFGTIALWLACGALLDKAAWRAIAPFVPWIALAYVLAKGVIAIAIVRALRDRQLLSPHRLAGWSALWLLIAAALWIALRTTIPAQWIGPRLLAAAVLWFLPANRLLLAPLGLHLNRHR